MPSNTQPDLPISRQSQTTEPSFPAKFIDCMTSFKLSAALKAGIELDLFTVLAGASQTLNHWRYVYRHPPVAFVSSVIT